MMEESQQDRQIMTQFTWNELVDIVNRYELSSVSMKWACMSPDLATAKSRIGSHTISIDWDKQTMSIDGNTIKFNELILCRDYSTFEIAIDALCCDCLALEKEGFTAWDDFVNALAFHDRHIIGILLNIRKGQIEQSVATSSDAEKLFDKMIRSWRFQQIIGSMETSSFIATVNKLLCHLSGNPTAVDQVSAVERLEMLLTANTKQEIWGKFNSSKAPEMQEQTDLCREYKNICNNVEDCSSPLEGFLEDLSRKWKLVQSRVGSIAKEGGANADSTMVTTSMEATSIEATLEAAPEMSAPIGSKSAMSQLATAGSSSSSAAEATPKEIYAPFFPIIQSSGTGKTRMVLECQRTHFLIYINIRKMDSSGSPRRSSIADVFIECCKSPQQFVKFISILFSEIGRNIDKIESLISQDGFTVFTAFHHLLWRSDNIWNQVGTNFCNQESKSIEVDLHSEGQVLVRDAQTTMNTLMQRLRGLAPNAKSGTMAPLFLFAVDEGRQLIDVDKRNLFVLFRKHTGLFLPSTRESAGIMFVVLDTTSRVSNFAPPYEYDPSGRIAQYKTIPLQTFYAMAFTGPWDIESMVYKDMHVVEEYRDGNSNVLFRYNLAELLRYSRPLYLANAKKWEDLIRTGMYKLSGRNKSCNTLTPTGLIALMSARLPLIAMTSTIADDLVSNHQATLVRIRHENRSFEVKYIPEPIISEVAAWSLIDDSVYSRALDEICSRVLDGSLGFAYSKGGRGEFSALLYFMRLYDKCVHRISSNNNITSHPPLFKCNIRIEYEFNPLILHSRPIPLRSYLEAICGESSGRLDMASACDGLPMLLLSFTAWHTFSSDPTKHSISWAFRKRFAVVCRENQEAVDLLIPLAPAKSSSFPEIKQEIGSQTAQDVASPCKSAKASVKAAPARSVKRMKASEKNPEISDKHTNASEAMGSTNVNEQPRQAGKRRRDHGNLSSSEEKSGTKETLYDDQVNPIEGISAIAIQVKNWATGMTLDAAKEHCNRQVEFMRRITGTPIVSILVMVGAGIVTLENHESTCLFKSDRDNESICIILNGFTSSLIDASQRERLTSMCWAPSPMSDIMVDEERRLKDWATNEAAKPKQRKLMRNIVSRYQGDEFTENQLQQEITRHNIITRQSGTAMRRNAKK